MHVCHSNNTRGGAEVRVCGSLNFQKNTLWVFWTQRSRGCLFASITGTSYQTSQVDYTCVLASWTSLKQTVKHIYMKYKAHSQVLSGFRIVGDF